MAPERFQLGEGRESLLVHSANGFFRDGEAASESGNAVRNEKAARDVGFASLVDRHARLMYRIAFSLLRNAQDAEDAVQEALLKLYRGEAWRHINDEQAFLARSIWRVALDRLPKERVRQSADLNCEQLADTAHSPEERAILEQRAGHLRKLIDGLPDSLRQPLVLSAIEDLNSREVGILLDIPEGTVRTRLKQAREELRRRFHAVNRSGK